MTQLAHVQEPYANHLVLIHAQLNPQAPRSFYAAFPASETVAFFTKQFDMPSPLNHASWLNRGEIELSAMAKRCLGRRIGDH